MGASRDVCRGPPPLSRKYARGEVSRDAFTGNPDARFIRDNTETVQIARLFFVVRLLLELNVNPSAPTGTVGPICRSVYISCILVALALGSGAHVRLGTSWWRSSWCFARLFVSVTPELPRREWPVRFSGVVNVVHCVAVIFCL